MRRLFTTFAVTVFALLFFSVAHAQSCASPPGYPGTTYNTTGKIITYYVPHAAPGCGSSMEGCIATSCPYAEPVSGGYAKTPVCLDAVRLKKAKYVTLSSAASNYGKYFNLGTITYRSALDNQVYTVENVIGYVHDTGCAFNGTCSAAMRARYGFSSSPRPDKIDVCTTICPTCNDKTAGDYALGKNVSRIPSGQGAYDPSPVTGLGAPVYGNSALSALFSPPQQGIAVSTGVGAYPAQGAHPSSGVPGQPSIPTTPLVGSQSTDGGASNLPGPAVATLLSQTTTVTRGRTMTISWSSLGMSSLPQCRLAVTFPGSAEQVIQEDNNGSEMVRVPLSSGTGTANIRLRCVSAKGDAVEKTASVTVE